MGESGAQDTGRPILSLADDGDSGPVAVSWAGSYLALGARLARYATDRPGGRQLVVTLSVPAREFVAALIGAGWTLTRPPRPGPGDPIDVLDSFGVGTWYRAVNMNHVYLGQLREFDTGRNPPRIRYAGSHFSIDGFRTMAPAPVGAFEGRQERPSGGSIVRYTGAIRDWDDRLVAPAQDLAIVGIESRLRADMTAVITARGDSDGDRLSTLLLPRHDNSTTWFSQVYSSATLEEAPTGFEAVILDGQGAIKFIAEILSPIAVCVVDRSVGDETQAENLSNMRRTEGTEVLVSHALGWHPPLGIEVMAFEVRL